MAVKNAVAKVEATDVAVFDYGDDLGAGFENVKRSDVSIPFIEVLQSNSPEITEMDAAKPGMLHNTASHELIKGAEGIIIVPVFTRHVYVEWRPREAGGGIVATHEIDSPVVKAAIASAGTSFGNIPNGDNELIETYYLFVVVIGADGTLSPAVISFTSTKIKVFKNWLFQATSVTAKTKDGRRVPLPLFAHKYRLTTVAQKNNKGSFFNYALSFDGPDAASCRIDPKSDLFATAKELYGAIQAGEAKADTSSLRSSDVNSDTVMVDGCSDKDEIPF